ncbi:MAG: glycosyltransferase [Leadbetterella sp.]|nr:glycosyltransferase [Leadbetterella sp.]
MAARKKGAFVNATPGENFGLTIVEAAASGLPVVASPTGGPKEIVESAQNGILVNVDNPTEIAQALKKVISDQNRWDEYSKNGIISSQETYSWAAHATCYIDLLDSLHKSGSNIPPLSKENPGWGNRLLRTPVFFISDLDGTLIEGETAPGLPELMEFLSRNRDKIVFGISTGRNLTMTKEALRAHPLLAASEIIICSVGTGIYYTKDFLPDRGWERHIRFQWKREKLKELLKDYPGLTLQEEEAQTPYKLSYYVNSDFGDDQLADMYHLLYRHQLRARLFLTDNHHLDLVPPRAGKGKALHYLGYKWKKDIRNFIASGNGGNDLGMLGGRTNGIVVNNHSPELVVLKENPNVYFSANPLASGVMEGIQHYLRSKKHLAGIQ